MARDLTNIGASVRARLMNHARNHGMDFQLVLTRYVLERLLYRLSVSKHKDQFILKGAMLYAVWLFDPIRATRDIDLLARSNLDAERIAHSFKEILSTEVLGDGVSFDIQRLLAAPIRENAAYGGIRVTTTATVSGARIPVRVDVGFGDAITPKPSMIEYPVLLDLPQPKVMAYPRETVVAEKFEAIVSLGLANSRMKDFHDIAMLAKTFEFDGVTLASAIAATFKRRGTELPNPSLPVLTPEFTQRPETAAQWKAFVAREELPDALQNLSTVVSQLDAFLMPPTQSLVQGKPFIMLWPEGGPWKVKKNK